MTPLHTQRDALTSAIERARRLCQTQEVARLTERQKAITTALMRAELEADRG